MQAKGNAAFSAGQYDEAIKYFTEAIGVDPSNHVLFSNRSASYVRPPPTSPPTSNPALGVGQQRACVQGGTSTASWPASGLYG